MNERQTPCFSFLPGYRGGAWALGQHAGFRIACKGHNNTPLEVLSICRERVDRDQIMIRFPLQYIRFCDARQAHASALAHHGPSVHRAQGWCQRQSVQLWYQPAIEALLKTLRSHTASRKLLWKIPVAFMRHLEDGRQPLEDARSLRDAQARG